MDFSVLSYIAREIQKENIKKWAVGASVMLYFHGLVENPSDIDIVVAEDEIGALKKLLCRLGTFYYDGSNEDKEPYLTKYFYKFKVKNVDLDVMAGFNLSHEKGIYEYIIDDEAIKDYAEVEGVKIPLCTPEDWYILYQLMTNREPKVKLIEDYLKQNGIKNRKLLERALNKNLPSTIKERIEGLF